MAGNYKDMWIIHACYCAFNDQITVGEFGMCLGSIREPVSSQVSLANRGYYIVRVCISTTSVLSVYLISATTAALVCFTSITEKGKLKPAKMIKSYHSN